MAYDQTLSGIPYKELHDDSGKVTIAKDSSGVRSFQCAWANRILFAAAHYGYTEMIGGTLFIHPATPHPDYPALYPDTINISPVGKPSGVNTWSDAKLEINYKPLNYKPDSNDPQDLIEERLRTSYDILLIPAETYTMDDGHLNTRDQIEVVIPKVEYDLTIHRVPTLPFSKVVAFMGTDTKPCVNSTTFRGAAAGHMLFLGCDADRKTTTFGVQNWDVTYHFLWSHIDHRKEYDPKTDTFLQKNHNVSGAPRYLTADFNQLLY